MSEPLGDGIRDHDSRRLIVERLDANVLVEASAGSGKTESLARRMVAGIEAGKYRVQEMAAVTFTRKAAAELRARFQGELEARLSDEGPGRALSAEGRALIQQALQHLERLFAGTIHAFCAKLLREHPVEAGIVPGFREMDDVEDGARIARGWRAFLDRKRAEGSTALREIEDAGVAPIHLEDELRRVCTFADVEFPGGSAERPDVASALQAIQDLAGGLRRLRADQDRPGSTCGTQEAARRFVGLLGVGRSDPSGVAQLLEVWERPPKIVQKWWADEKHEQKAIKRELEALLGAFREVTAAPWLRQWRAYLYRLAVGLLVEARQELAVARRREGRPNYADLLELAAQLLREHRITRRRLGEKYRWLLVDELQDTNPRQAEVLLLLADPEGPERWRDTCPRPGALFAVGDPKQSIFRFSEADIQVYDDLRTAIRRSGGEVVALTTSFRSLPVLCEWANEVFATEGFFPATATVEQPAFHPLEPAPGCMAPAGVATGVHVLELVAKKADEVVASDAAAVASIIRTAVDRGAYRFQDFLVLTRKRGNLPRYAAALDALHVPHAVCGSVAFGSSSMVASLVTLLRALADPDDGVAVVGTLRGSFFGLSDPELYGWHRHHGSFLYTVPRAEDSRGVVADAMRRLSDWHRLTRDKPLAAAIEQILDDSGILASAAAATPGGSDAGDLLHAVQRIRSIALDGASLSDAADALAEDLVGRDVESIPLEPGLEDVVRVMNLHRAKGLEARVVFLADPVSGVAPKVDIRVDRSGPTPLGYLTLVKEYGEHGKRVIGQPIDWPVHEATERAFLEAEEKRLLYVAGTRSRELLVVSQAPNASPKSPPWAPFAAFLEDADHVILPAGATPPLRDAPDLRIETCKTAAATRAASRAAAGTPSWKLESVTATAHRAAPTGRPVTTGRTREPDAGIAWGKLVHALLEHALRRGSPDRRHLERFAAWLTMDDDNLRGVVPEAVDAVLGVMASEFWREATAAEEKLAEVPFALLEAAEGGRRVLQGIVDLAYRTSTGWHIVDYKTDRIPEGGATALVARYAAQLDTYASAWREMVPQGPVDWRLYVVRERRSVSPISPRPSSPTPQP